jgi:hypothetical protein
LNENGYPNLSPQEAMAAIKLCTDLIYADQSDSSSSTVFHTSGHFYTNDIKVTDSQPLYKYYCFRSILKVLVDILTRELRNIPFQASNDSAPLTEYRYMYTDLLYLYSIYIQHYFSGIWC